MIAQPENRIMDDDPIDLVVRFTAEGGGQQKTYDLSSLPVSPELQECFADGFRRLTGPAGTRRTISSADSALRLLKNFAKLLSELDNPPSTTAQLSGHHADAAKLRFASRWMDMRSTLRATFLGRKGVPANFQQKLMEPSAAPRVQNPVNSYSVEEHRLVMRAARETVRSAYERTAAALERVNAYRAGGGPDDRALRIGLEFQSQVLQDGYVKTHDAPRSERDRFRKLGLFREPLAQELFLGRREMGALAVLMVGVTGENLGQILTLPAEHHRADSQDGADTPIALSRASKPRRGAAQSEMTIPLTGYPTWDDSGDEAERESTEDESVAADLRSAFGVHSAADRMSAPARRLSGSDRLIVGFVGRGGGRQIREVEESDVYAWYQSLAIVDREGRTVRANSMRLRRTFVEAKQKPVAHSVATFVNTYLLRDRGNISEYQRVVARVLNKEVARAKAAIARVISASTVELAATDPGAAAALVGTDVGTLEKALSGELDTVMTSCLDNEHSPYSAAGSPCGASFMLCLGCPNARAEPRHLPVQLLVLRELEARRLEMEPIGWATKFAIHHARLQNLLSQFPEAIVDAARGTETAEDVALVERFLGRELDVK